MNGHSEFSLHHAGIFYIKLTNDDSQYIKQIMPVTI